MLIYNAEFKHNTVGVLRVVFRDFYSIGYRNRGLFFTGYLE